MINAFQDTFCYTLHFEQDYSTGGNNGSLIQKTIQLLGHSLSLSLYLYVSLFVCLFVSLFVCLFVCLSLCLFVSLSLCQGEGRGGELKCYRHTDIQTYRQTYRSSDEEGLRGAFAPKKKKSQNRFKPYIQLSNSNDCRKILIPCLFLMCFFFNNCLILR